MRVFGKYWILAVFVSAPLMAAHISTQRVAFVDIEKIMSFYPSKKESANEFAAKRQSYEDEIKKIESRIRALELQEIEFQDFISTLTSISTSTVSASTSTVNAADEIAALSARKEKLRKIIDEELPQLEKEAEMQIMGKIYEAIKKVALEKSFDLVIESSKVLWGIPGTDITEDVLEILKEEKN